MNKLKNRKGVASPPHDGPNVPRGTDKLAGWALLVVLVSLSLLNLCACSHVVEEHIEAREGLIQFDRVAGRKVATGGFTLNKDSLVMKPN